MVRRVTVYVILVTWLLAMMDWAPIHASWWNYGQWPAWAGSSFSQWTAVRHWAGLILCPPCAALAENYYFALFEVEAGQDEQHDLLQAPYSGNLILPDGPRFWWGQGPGRPWRPVSMLSWYLYWLPPSVLWWLVVGDVFKGRRPWWMLLFMKARLNY